MKINNYPLWTALITPLLANGKIDFDSLKKLLHQQEEAGNGVLILGSTGEALNLSMEEKKQILNFTLEQKLSVPLMAGVGGINLDETLHWVKYLNTLSLDCYLMVTPLYAKPGAQGQYQWFKTLLDSSSKPVMLYNIPGRAGTALNHQAVKKLNGHPNFWAIKEASGSTQEFDQYVKDAPNARVYSGDDGMMPAFTKLGAKGLVSVASNVWPQRTKNVVTSCLDGNFTKEQLWEECSDSLFTYGNPVTIKGLMHKLQMIKTPFLRPPLSHQDLTDMAQLINANENVTNNF